MSKKVQPKGVSIYDENMVLIVSSLRTNPRFLVNVYKEKLVDCLKAVPKKLWKDNDLLINLLSDLPEAHDFIKGLPDLSEKVYVKLVTLEPKNFKLVPTKMLKQEFINKLISSDIKAIHNVPSEWKTAETLDCFYSNYSGEKTLEIVNELKSYSKNLNTDEINDLVEKHGVLSFVKEEVSIKQVEESLNKNAFNLYTIPSVKLKENFVVMAIEKNPEVVTCENINWTDKVKEAFLKVVASMDKLSAKSLLNRVVSSFVKMLQEYDSKVKIVKDWSFVAS